MREEEFRQLAEHRSRGVLREFYDFLRCNKKWWLGPIILVLLLLGLIVILGTAAPPGRGFRLSR